MADAADTYEQEPLHDANAQTGTAPELDLGQLTSTELEHLTALRARVDSGDVHEWSGDYKRLRFTRWLYEQGKLQS